MSDSYFKKTPDELRRIMDTSPPDTPAYIKARDALNSRSEPLKSYVYQPYPRMLYHWKLGQTTVQSEQEEEQHLEKGWVNTPADVWKPRRLYHPTFKTDGHIFESPEEEAEALANDWVDSPAKFPSVKSPAATKQSRPMNKRDVFVIHGRNENLRSSMFDFLRSLGLNPLEWGELIAKTQSAAPYIGEVLDAGFKQAGAVIGLLTPDDLAFLNPALWSASEKDHETRPTPQARPNVLFELGMAFALHPERTVIVQIGELRPFSDVGGRHVIYLDDSAKKRTELRDRLKTAGCDVKEHGTDWLTTGKFVITKTPRYQVLPVKEGGSVGAGAIDQITFSDKSVAQRRSYGFAVFILRKLGGEFFQNSSLPGHLWASRDGAWHKIMQELGRTDAYARFLPYTEPSQFDEADEMKMEAAALILSLYLWAAKNNPDFETIRHQHGLPDPERVAENLSAGDLPNKYAE